MILGNDYLRSIGAVAICDDVQDFREEYLEAYVIADGLVVLDLDMVRSIKKGIMRRERRTWLQDLDVEYFVEAQKIYASGIFRKTKAMDDIFRKKDYLRNAPQLVDSMTNVNEVIQFEIDIDTA